MTGRRFVIGVGNPDRGDDAVGRIIAENLHDRGVDGFEIVAHDGEVTGLLNRLESADAAFLVDAAASGAAPGTVHRFDANDGPLPPAVFAVSTHGFGLAEAVELARAMGSLPPVCVIFAVEGESFEIGRRPSEAVLAAAKTVERRILSEILDEEPFGAQDA